VRTCEPQNESPNQSRQKGTGQHTNLDLILQVRRGRKRKKPDEQAHREPDPAQQRNPIDLRPRRMFRALRSVELDGDPGREKDPDRLSGQQTGRDPEREGREQGWPAHARHRDTRIGESEEE
jgi:hypothetical protein